MERIGRNRSVRIHKKNILETNWKNVDDNLNHLIKTMVEYSILDLIPCGKIKQNNCEVQLNSAEMEGLIIDNDEYIYEIHLKSSSSLLPPRKFCLKFGFPTY